jgi:AcrR family transcriptional regulator
LIKHQKPVYTELNQNDDPRLRILNAALEVFALHGRDGARTRDIAQAAGVNLAMLHYYFSSKEELYVRAVSPLLADIFGRLKTAAQSASDPRARLEALVGFYFDFLKDHPHLPRVMMWELVTGAKALRQIFSGPLQNEKGDLNANFRKIFQDGQARGVFRADNPDQAILSTVALCVFPFIARDLIAIIRPGLTAQPDFLAERRQHVLQLLLRGLQADENGKAEAKSEPSSEDTPGQTSLTL